MGYYPPPPPPQPTPPPASDDCTDMPGANQKTLVDIALSCDGLTGEGLLPNAQLLRLDFGDPALTIGNPLAPDCPEAQAGSLIDLSGGLPLLGATGSTGDLLHLALAGTATEIANPLGGEAADGTPPLISIDAQGQFLMGGSSSDDDGDSSLLAGLLGTGAGTGSGAAGPLAGLLGFGDTDGSSDTDCGCGQLLQQVLDLIPDMLDGQLV